MCEKFNRRLNQQEKLDLDIYLYSGNLSQLLHQTLVFGMGVQFQIVFSVEELQWQTLMVLQGKT